MTRRLKIVFYSVSVSPYGAPTSLLNLIEGLLPLNAVDMVVVVPKEGPLTQKLRKLGVRIVVLPFYKWTYKTRYYDTLKRRSRLYAGLWFYKNAIQKLVLNFAFLPIHLIKINSLKPDIVYVNASMSPMGVLVAKILGRKSLWHHREPLNDPQTDFFVEWSPRIAQRVLNYPDVRVYNSRFLQSMFGGERSAFKGKSFVVYNGVPPSGSAAVITRDRVTFGMVGKIEAGVRKGQEEVIDVFNQPLFGNVALNIYGGGEPAYLAKLKSGSRQDRVFFFGFVAPANIYSEIDFLIVNSRNESFGRVVAEAYAYGVPVIALRSGALPEIVDDDVTGFLYNDKPQLTTLVNRAAELRHTEKYAAMKDACTRKYNECFTVPAYTAKMFDILKSIVHD